MHKSYDLDQILNDIRLGRIDAEEGARRYRDALTPAVVAASTFNRAEPQAPESVTENALIQARIVLVEALAAETKLPAAKIKTGEPFERFGIDSMMVTNLTR